MFLYTVTAHDVISRQTFVKQYRASSPEELKTILNSSAEYYYAGILDIKVQRAD